jgi:hypothetical protein
VLRWQNSGLAVEQREYEFLAGLVNSSEGMLQAEIESLSLRHVLLCLREKTNFSQ